MRVSAGRFACASVLSLVAGFACSESTSPKQSFRAATALSFMVQPAAGVKDTALATAVQVALLDNFGSVLTTATNTITLAIGANPGGATLTGTTSAAAASGVATFDGLKLDKVGTGYTLVAASTGLPSVTSSAFAITLSLADVDADGFSPNQGDCKDTDPAVHPNATDMPDAGYVDTNCDGMDGDSAKAVFVATTGSNGASCGSMATPCQSLDTAIARAAAAGKRDVYIAAGTYNGAVKLADGVSLYGKFGAGWTRGPGNLTTLVGKDSVDVAGVPEALAILASGLTKTTVVADLHLVGPNPAGRLPGGSGRSAYAVVVRNVAAGVLTIARNTIVAGNGTDGAAGGTGVDAALVTATTPMRGGIGANALQTTTTCDDATRMGGGGAGANGAATAGGNGGAGGTMDTDCSLLTMDLTARPGLAGGNAAIYVANTYGFGGPGGAGSSSCGPGRPGAFGFTVNGVAGLAAPAGGALQQDDWAGQSGGAGSAGNNGTGGGGGGGSGGCDTGTDAYGAGGGGGGAGGLAAVAGGSGGLGGGGSFGIYLVNASPAILGDSILRGNGGNGGAGGTGGQGQSGGLGGAGGLAVSGSASAGGAGGAGAHGGHGGGGGGGAGGTSAAIYGTSGSSVATVTGLVASGGTAGLGGAGGPSAPNAPVAERDGNAGQRGNDGGVIAQGTCSGATSC